MHTQSFTWAGAQSLWYYPRLAEDHNQTSLLAGQEDPAEPLERSYRSSQQVNLKAQRQSSKCSLV